MVINSDDSKKKKNAVHLNFEISEIEISAFPNLITVFLNSATMLLILFGRDLFVLSIIPWQTDSENVYVVLSEVIN